VFGRSANAILILLLVAIPAACAPAHAGLHRMDFSVKGTSCAVCLISIQSTLKNNTAVEKVAVMLKKPYGGVVVYDAAKTNFDKLFKPVLARFKKVSITVIEDKPIEHVPMILVPKGFTSLDKTQEDKDDKKAN